MGSLPRTEKSPLSLISHQDLVSLLASDEADSRVIQFVKDGELMGQDFMALTQEELNLSGSSLGIKLAVLRSVAHYKKAVVIPVESSSSPIPIPRSVCETPRRSPRLACKRALTATMESESPLAPKRVPCAAVAITQESSQNLLPKFPQYLPNCARSGNYAYVRIDVKATMKREGLELVHALRSGVLQPSQRKQMCVIQIHQLMVPHADAKVQLAKDIVNAWPRLKSPVGDAWNAFSCPGGHLDMALRPLRTSHNARLRKSSSSQVNNSKATAANMATQPNQHDSVEPTLEQKIQMANLSSTEETPENREAIFLGMQSLADYRSQMVKDGKSVNEIVHVFPKLLSFQGALVEADFAHKHGNLGATFCGSFRVLYSDAILDYCKNLHPKHSVASLVLATKGSTSNAKGKGLRGGVTIDPPNLNVGKDSIPHPALLQVVPTNTDVSSYESIFWRTKITNGPKIVQPYLLMSSDDNTNGDFYLKANDLTIHLGSNALRAFVVLVKYHYVFNVDYDIDILHFYMFFEYLIGLPRKLPVKMLELLGKLRNWSK